MDNPLHPMVFEKSTMLLEFSIKWQIFPKMKKD
jgi:hypothetical protein